MSKTLESENEEGPASSSRRFRPILLFHRPEEPDAPEAPDRRRQGRVPVGGQGFDDRWAGNADSPACTGTTSRRKFSGPAQSRGSKGVLRGELDRGPTAHGAGGPPTTMLAARPGRRRRRVGPALLVRRGAPRARRLGLDVPSPRRQPGDPDRERVLHSGLDDDRVSLTDISRRGVKVWKIVVPGSGTTSIRPPGLAVDVRAQPRSRRASGIFGVLGPR